MLSMVVTSLGGFLFWQLAARLLSQAQVGVVATLISCAMLLATFGLVGMDMAVLHYMNRWPDSKAETAVTGLTVVAAATAVAATVFVLAARLLVPSITILRQPVWAAAFVVLTVGVSTNLFADSLFISLRESRFVLARTVVLNVVRLGGPLLVAGLLSFAVFAVYTGGAAIALLLATVILSRRLGLRLRPRVDRSRLQAMWRFSAGNYAALTISGMPIFLLPVLVSNGLGPARAALWFLAALISGMLTSIPQATTQSFYAEITAEPGAVRSHLVKVLRLTLLYEIPGLAALLIVGWPLLALFGGHYTDAYPVLVLLSLAGAVASVGYVGRTILLAAGRLRLLTGYSATFCVLVLAFCWAAEPGGLVAVAGAWLLAEVLTSLLYARVVLRCLAGGRLPCPTTPTPVIPPVALTGGVHG